jgi:hypothetical protein
VLEPSLEEPPDSLPLVRQRGALLHVTQDLWQLIGYLTACATVHGLAAPLAVAPAEIDSRDPSTVRPLRDRPFTSSASF